MRITARKHSGMVQIEGDGIAYGNIKDMYQTGDGHGLQLNTDKNYDEIFKLCHKVASCMYQIEELIQDGAE